MILARYAILTLMALLCLTPRLAQAGPFDTLAAGGKGGWLNVTRPVTAADMQGRMVLLDFWTYGCINCMQIVPDLTALEEEFGDRLLVIGVHSAKFEGEKDNARILAAAKRFGLKHPVINDSDYAVWKSFGVQAWPTQILLGPDGAEINRYSGEGHRAAISADIAAVLAHVAAPAPLAGLVPAGDSKGTLSFPARLAHAAQSPWGQVFFVADSGHNRIAVFGPDATEKASIGTGVAGFADGTFATAQFDHPRGLAVAGTMLYIADTGNHRIRQVDLAAGTVRTVAGTGARGFDRTPDGAPALTAALASPWDVEMMDDSHTLAIANAGTHQILSYDTDGKTLSLIAGSGREAVGDGPARRATLAQPSGLSRDGGALFFADAESSALRVIEDGKVKTLVGTGLFDFGLKDGPYPAAMMQHPQGLFAETGRVIVADTYNNTLRLYDRRSGILSTIPLSGPALNEPGDVIVVDGIAYIADTGGHAVYTVDMATGATKRWK